MIGYLCQGYILNRKTEMLRNVTTADIVRFAIQNVYTDTLLVSSTKDGASSSMHKLNRLVLAYNGEIRIDERGQKITLENGSRIHVGAIEREHEIQRFHGMGIQFLIVDRSLTDQTRRYLMTKLRKSTYV